jgi:hypothetical protein
LLPELLPRLHCLTLRANSSLAGLTLRCLPTRDPGL